MIVEVLSLELKFVGELIDGRAPVERIDAVEKVEERSALVGTDVVLELAEAEDVFERDVVVDVVSRRVAEAEALRLVERALAIIQHAAEFAGDRAGSQSLLNRERLIQGVELRSAERRWHKAERVGRRCRCRAEAMQSDERILWIGRDERWRNAREIEQAETGVLIEELAGHTSRSDGTRFKRRRVHPQDRRRKQFGLDERPQIGLGIGGKRDGRRLAEERQCRRHGILIDARHNDGRAVGVAVEIVEDRGVLDVVSRPQRQGHAARPIVTVVEILAGRDVRGEAVADGPAAGNAEQNLVLDDWNVDGAFDFLVVVVAELRLQIAFEAVGRLFGCEEDGAARRVAAEERALWSLRTCRLSR